MPTISEKLAARLIRQPAVVAPVVDRIDRTAEFAEREKIERDGERVVNPLMETLARAKAEAERAEAALASARLKVADAERRLRAARLAIGQRRDRNERRLRDSAPKEIDEAIAVLHRAKESLADEFTYAEELRENDLFSTRPRVSWVTKIVTNGDEITGRAERILEAIQQLQSLKITPVDDVNVAIEEICSGI